MRPPASCEHASSPPAWGCLPPLQQPRQGMQVLPTRVGVPRCVMAVEFEPLGPPHPRGGASPTSYGALLPTPSSPPAWGCLSMAIDRRRDRPVLPTRVGVPRPGCVPSWRCRRPPHPRGGASSTPKSSSAKRSSSPPAWGCLRAQSSGSWRGCVLPTRVGVPRTVSRLAGGGRSVLPTRVGVPPWAETIGDGGTGPPHPRGGASLARSPSPLPSRSSPPAWGCLPLPAHPSGRQSVLPTRVGVPRGGLMARRKPGRPPHPRGGASIQLGARQSVWTSSPPAWGCLPEPRQPALRRPVLPTRVGVPPVAAEMAGAAPSPPHPRGGASSVSTWLPSRRLSSPPAWGCLRRHPRRLCRWWVLPTRVGVPLSRRSFSRSSGRSSPPAWGCLTRVAAPCAGRSGPPHSRGGASLTRA